MALATSGCWWFRQEPPAPERPSPGITVRGITRLGVVRFADATHQGVGQRVTEVFRQEIARTVGQDWVRPTELQAPPPSPPAIGFIGISQAQTLGRLNQVDGLLSGQVQAYQWQPSLGRVWVSVSLRLLETSRGTIMWSRNAKGTFPARSPSELDEEFNAATHLAAKEFVNDLLGFQP